MATRLLSDVKQSALDFLVDIMAVNIHFWGELKGCNVIRFQIKFLYAHDETALCADSMLLDPVGASRTASFSRGACEHAPEDIRRI